MQRRFAQGFAVALAVALLFWGAFTLIAYTGATLHGAVLFTEGSKPAISTACGDGTETMAMVCRGARGLFSALERTVLRGEPLLWYGVISATAFLAFLGWQYFRRRAWRVTITVMPWKLVAIFCMLLWLLFTTFTFGSDGERSLRWIIEPVPQVYTESPPEALTALRKNFDSLQARKCATPIGKTSNGAAVLSMRFSCMQAAFFTRVLPQVLFVGFLFAELLILGSAIIRMLRLRVSILAEMMLSIAAGICAMIVMLWTLAVLGLYTQVAGWAVLLAIPVLCRRDLLHWGKRFLRTRIPVELTTWSPLPVLAWALLSLLVLNFLTVVRPFPIGWDDLGVYLNQPRLLVSYGHFIPTLSRFQWEYITSLGFLLFGYDSIGGATAAMETNYLAGLLAVLSIYTFARLYLGNGSGIVAALLYYFLPVVGHFSFADMKVDNAIFTMGALSMLAAFLGLFHVHAAVRGDGEEQQAPRRVPLFALAGVFAGVAFAMKPTAVMVFVTTAAAINGGILGGLGFVASVLLTIALYLWEGRLNIAEITGRVLGTPSSFAQRPLLIVFFLFGVVFLISAAWRNRAHASRALLAIGLFVGAFLAAIAPWVVSNSLRFGHLRPHLILSAPNTITPTFEISGGTSVSHGQPIRSLPPDLAVNPNHPACKSTGKTEELDRYWGYGGGWKHYLLLPWRSVMNLDAPGYYVMTLPVLLLFPLLLLVPAFWGSRCRWLRYLFWGTLWLVIQWIFLANGIPWYGVGMFFGLVICLEAMIREGPSPVARGLGWFFVVVSLCIAFSLRMWQFEQQRNLLEYAVGKTTAEVMRERTITYYDNVRDVILARAAAMKDRPYVFRIGTFIPYFIPRNLEVLPVADNQLDLFTCLHQEKDPQLTLQRLKALGFNSILFDTNTATIEKNEQGSLHKKVDAFVDFLNTPGLGFQVVVNDLDAGMAFLLIP